MHIDHDLNQDELDFLASRFKRETKRWYWVRRPGSKERIRNPCLQIKDRRIVFVSADGDHSSAEVVRSVYEAVVARHERRKESAKKAAVTRAKRMDRKVYAAARALKENRLRPGINCIVCGRGLGDEESISRGIGSDCWQSVLNVLYSMNGNEDRA